MNLRYAARMTGLLVAVAALGCSDATYKTTDLDSQFVVSPLYTGVDQGTPVQFQAMIGTTAVPVTWESSNTAVATVSTTGLVTTLIGGFSAITATQTGNTSIKKSASLTVFPLLGIGVTSGVPVTGIGGVVGDDILYRIFVPEGATNLTVTMSGGTGDLDLYVQRATPPTTSQFACRSWNGGNTENCSFTNPASGTWYIMIDVYTDGTGVTLTATRTP